MLPASMGCADNGLYPSAFLFLGVVIRAKTTTDKLLANDLDQMIITTQHFVQESDSGYQ